MMKSTFMIIALAAIIVVVVMIIILNSFTQYTQPISYVNNFKKLLSNGSFTATYNSSYVEFTMSGPGNQIIQCNDILQFGAGSVNNSRAFIDTIRTMCEGLFSGTPGINMQEMAYWINGSSLCGGAVYVVMDGHKSGSINCLPLEALNALPVYLPFNELLGNVTFSTAVQGYSISITSYINYVNTTRWHDQQVHCFRVISNITRVQSIASGFRLRTSTNLTELICLLPSGLPAIRVINETMLVTPLPSGNAILYTIQGKTELVNYTLNYFNTTEFNEIVSMARSRGNG